MEREYAAARNADLVEAKEVGDQFRIIDFSVYFEFNTGSRLADMSGF